jgi:hypothetical protein
MPYRESFRLNLAMGLLREHMWGLRLGKRQLTERWFFGRQVFFVFNAIMLSGLGDSKNRISKCTFIHSLLELFCFEASCLFFLDTV